MTNACRAFRLTALSLVFGSLLSCGRELEFSGNGDVYYGTELNSLKCKNTFRPEGRLVEPSEFFSRKVNLRFREAVMYGETLLRGDRPEAETSVLAGITENLEISVKCVDYERRTGSGYFAGGVIFATPSGATTLTGPDFKIGRSFAAVLPVGEGIGSSVIAQQLKQSSLPEYFFSKRGQVWSGAAIFENGSNVWITLHQTFDMDEQMRRFDFSALRYEIQE
jgi:hypothetical protein